MGTRPVLAGQSLKEKTVTPGRASRNRRFLPSSAGAGDPGVHVALETSQWREERARRDEQLGKHPGWHPAVR